MNTDLQTRSAVSMSMQLSTLAEIREFCAILANTNMVPKAYLQKPDDILVAILHGQELGLPHLQALQSIAVVNGIPSIYGDAGLAMVRASEKLEDFDEWFEVDGERQPGSSFPIIKWAEEEKVIVAYCMSKRVGAQRQRITTYSVDDAKRAKLWLKKKVYPNGDVVESPWCTTPQRMLMFRARGWNLRDEFGDVLKGLSMYEEAMDIDTEAGKDGVYRPVIVDPIKEAADLKAVQDRLKEQQQKANGNGATNVIHAKPVAVPTDTAPVVPAETTQAKLLVDTIATKAMESLHSATPIKKLDLSKLIPQPEWDKIVEAIHFHPDYNDARMTWQADNKVSGINKMTHGGQKALIAALREAKGFAFPY